MKALKDCKWIVSTAEILTDYENGWSALKVKYYFSAFTNSDSGLYGAIELAGERNYKTKQGAINNWKKFAEINGIQDYIIEE